MRHLRRIVERIAIGQYWRAPVQMSEHPVFLKPRHVPDFPKQGVNDLQARSDHLFVVQIGNQRDGAPPRLAQRIDKVDHERSSVHSVFLFVLKNQETSHKSLLVSSQSAREETIIIDIRRELRLDIKHPLAPPDFSNWVVTCF